METKISLLFFALLISMNSFSQITVTFKVDVTGFPVYSNGVHIAGQFAMTNSLSISEDWQPGAIGSQMIFLYDSTYSVDVTFPSTSAGDSLQFEFVRDNVWVNSYGDPSEGNPGDPENLLNDLCAVPDGTGPGGYNRLIVIPECGGVYDCSFNQCGFIQSIPCDTPGFACTNQIVCEKFCIDFTDQSSNNPIAWHWLFPGGSPSSSTLQNPTNICYDVPGAYDVTLIATYTSESDTLTLPNYIHVNATPSIPTITQTGYTLTSSPAAYYQWQFNAVDIPGATNQSYEVMQTGYYSVVVSNETGCENSATLWVQITGINEINDGSALSVFPNPFSNSTTISLSLSQSENASLQIFDLQGKLIRTLANEVMSEGLHTLEWDARDENANAMSAGIYFLKAKTMSDTKTILISVAK